MTAVEKQEEIITDYDSSAEFHPAGKQECNTADINMRDKDENADEMENNTAFQLQEEMNEPTVGAGYKSDPELPNVPHISGTIHQFVL